MEQKYNYCANFVPHAHLLKGAAALCHKNPTCESFENQSRYFEVLRDRAKQNSRIGAIDKCHA